MPDYEDLCYERRARIRKYTLCDKKRWNRRQWTILLSVFPLDDNEENDSPIASPLAGSGPGGHKPSFKSTKLARRARSFKDDFLGKISQMRSPTGPGLRSHSPKDRPSKSDIIGHGYPTTKGPIQELDNLWKQTQATLKHFKDVVSKQKLEMLPGNGTIVLDTVWQINLAVKSSVSSDYSSAIFSATNHMYQSVARLIKLCDDALIDDKSSELTKENVNEIVAQVEIAVQDLIRLAQEKISHQQIMYKTTPRSSCVNTSLEMPAQRNSLPDIPLTPRERELLEQNSHGPPLVRSSHSSESILRDSSPPPKPPLPDGVLFNISHSEPSSCITPPPLPPKKKNYKLHRPSKECCSIDNSPVTSSLERVSVRSKSPEDSISLLSASAGSLDSMLNHSRGEEDEEIKVIMDTTYDGEGALENHTSDIFGHNGSHSSWEESSLSSNISSQIPDQQYDYNRLSNTDSGFMSSQSYRSSSYSKRSSQQSSVSSQWVTHQHMVKQVSAEVKAENVVQNFGKDNEGYLTIRNFNQKTSSSSSSSSLVSTVMNLGHQITTNEPDTIFDDSLPPAIPQKTRRKQERQPSPYDNVPDSSLGGELLVTCAEHQSHQSLSSSTSVSSTTALDSNKPPPLPPKKKHIMAYMEMFGNCSHANEQEFMRHSVHMVQTHWGQSSTSGLPTTQSCSFNHTSHSSSRSSHSQIQILNVPHSTMDQRLSSPMHSPNTDIMESNSPPPALPPKQRSRISSVKTSPPVTPTAGEIKSQSSVSALPDLLEHTTNSKSNDDKNEVNEVSVCDIDLMEEPNVEKWLVMKKPDEEGPDIRGGPIDALIIQATKATKNGVFMYQEAFLTTYRTFITPLDLITKLIRRYEHFSYQPNKKLRSEAFALIVRVVNDLTVSDLDDELQCKLMNFVQQLISSGEITLAKALRVKHLERYEAKQLSLKYTSVVTSLSLSARSSTLLDFKSEQIAEQMTLLDAELFMKIEIPEVLIWAQEQNEERSPNLTRFTEHFNKMSYWARTRILTVDGKDVRERYFLKFIKIMKHLRKINNFNSYLALLSALDSAPIRRLEWQKHVQEGLKEYCALIDSSSSFRAYRQALAETQPPCIPYIGLVLQDLTFVHIGNSNLLSDGTINFSKRWQQFNIVENMKKFKKGTHSFKRHERIIQFFQNFDDFIGEDAMWQLSETIKPRGGKKPT
ncbi:guanine nucleotide-releasing factor 2 isoform X2 [Zophobas morio]|uniref:guanine nucleotide-releasing factor 2 isoform X2 n=1 Tax=Zophobas morio TaxID=2755281 RepID=UPI003083B69A